MHAKTTSIALLAVVIFALSNPLSAAQQAQQIAFLISAQVFQVAGGEANINTAHDAKRLGCK